MITLRPFRLAFKYAFGQSTLVQARALAAWIQERTALFNSGTEGTGAAELQSTLQEYLAYGATDRPAKIQALMDAEALHTICVWRSVARQLPSW